MNYDWSLEENEIYVLHLQSNSSVHKQVDIYIYIFSSFHHVSVLEPGLGWSAKFGFQAGQQAAYIHCMGPKYRHRL